MLLCLQIDTVREEWRHPRESVKGQRQNVMLTSKTSRTVLLFCSLKDCPSIHAEKITGVCLFVLFINFCFLQVGDAYLVASGILTPDEEGFNAVDEAHDPEKGAHRVLAFAQDMLRVSRLVS